MRLPDEQRRARLVHRHHLARTADDPVPVVRGIVAMHASDPLTGFLGVRARLRDPAGAIEDLETALYEDRSLWRLDAIRRTLFVAALDDARLLQAGAGRDVARKNVAGCGAGSPRRLERTASTGGCNRSRPGCSRRSATGSRGRRPD